MSISKIEILGAKVDNLSMNETLSKIEEAIDKQFQIHHSVVNASKLVDMQTNEELRNSVNAADIVNADGQSVVWGAKLLGKPLKERVAGIELMQEVVEIAAKNGHSVYFFGAKEDVVKKVVSIYSEKYDKTVIAGYRNGYFLQEDEEKIAQEIANSKANMLFVAISSPIKEIFLNKYKNVLKDINFIMGVGGSFDVVAGKVKRAPLWMQKKGLEWFYRFLQEPRRMWKRSFVSNIKFVKILLKEYYFTFSKK